MTVSVIYEPKYRIYMVPLSLYVKGRGPIGLAMADGVYDTRKPMKMVGPRWVARLIERLGHETDYPPPDMYEVWDYPIMNGIFSKRKPNAYDNTQGEWFKWESTYERL